MAMKSKQELKRALYQKVQEAQRKIIKNAGSAMEDIDQNASAYDQEDDIYDPTKSELRKQKELLAEQYQMAVKEDEVLQRMDPERLREQVEFGAVVITNKYAMFVSIGVGKVKVDNKPYFAVSTSVPVFQVMKGLKKGDTFEFNGNKFEIHDIF